MAALADFGIAALPVAGHPLTATVNVMTPAFAPPETFMGEEPTPAEDVYSLGATLYALLTDTPPRSPKADLPAA